MTPFVSIASTIGATYYSHTQTHTHSHSTHLDTKGVAWDRAFSGSVHDRNKAIRGWLGADALVGEVLAQQVADEGGLANGVLSQQQHDRRRIEVTLLQQRRVEVLIVVRLLQWTDLTVVQPLEPFDDRGWRYHLQRPTRDGCRACGTRALTRRALTHGALWKAVSHVGYRPRLSTRPDNNPTIHRVDSRSNVRAAQHSHRLLDATTPGNTSTSSASLDTASSYVGQERATQQRRGARTLAWQRYVRGPGSAGWRGILMIR